MVVYEATWEAPEFLQNLPKLLVPRILAAGYFLEHEDEGKQVYSRGPLPRWKFWGPSLDDFYRSFLLTVGYVLMPAKTSIMLTWENPRRSWCQVSGSKWAHEHAKTFFEYLNAWYEGHKKLG